MNTDKKKDKIILGNCKKPHGIKGGFSFFLENSEESVLKKGINVILSPLDSSSSLENDGEVFKIDKIAFGNKTITYLKGITDRNVVEEMIPFDIAVLREDMPEPDDGEFYIADLVGAQVFEQDTDRELGKVVEYFDNGAQIILSVQGQESFDIPFVEHFVPVVDSQNKKIWVIVPRLV